MFKKKIGGYLTLEATFIIFIIVMLYVFLITTSFYLYDRCLLNQDTYLLAFRANVFTDAEESYGEIVYGRKEKRFNSNDYVQSRIQRLMSKYPLYREREHSIAETETEVKIQQKGDIKIPFLDIAEQYIGKILIHKKVSYENPIEFIGNQRRK